jgi:hypothetical protein
MAGAFNECFSSSSGRASSHVSSTSTSSTATIIKNDSDNQLLATSENAVRHGASEAAAGLGPAQTSAAPGSSSINRQQHTAAGYYPGAGTAYPNPSAPMMCNSAPLTHHNNHHIRIRQFENATTQSTGHDRTGVGGGRNSKIDAGDVYPGSGGLPLPAEHHHPVGVTRAYDTPSSLGLTEVVGLS